MADSRSDTSSDDFSSAPILGPPIPFGLVSRWLAFALITVTGMAGIIFLFPPDIVAPTRPAITTVAKLSPVPGTPTKRPEFDQTILNNSSTDTEITSEPKIKNEKEAGDTQFAIDLGSTAALPSLKRRFRNISRSNSHLLGNLQARAQYSVSDNGPVVRLLLGPLETKQQARDLCEFMQLPQGINCQPSEFLGDPINS